MHELAWRWTKGLERSIQLDSHKICNLAQSTAQETQTGIGIQHQKKQIKWWLFQPPTKHMPKQSNNKKRTIVTAHSGSKNLKDLYETPTTEFQRQNHFATQKF